MRIVRLVALSIVLTCNAGCLSPFAMSTMGTAGGNAPVAFSSSGGGKGESFWIAQYDDVIDAVLKAGEVLSLELKEKTIEKDQAFFRFHDDKARGIDLFIERHTDSMTSVQLDVGSSGSVAFGRLMARQIIHELDESGSFLEDWTPVKP